MTPSEAVKKLNAMEEGGDNESLHREADDILCEVLRSIGPKYQAVADAFKSACDRVYFWYA